MRAARGRRSFGGDKNLQTLEERLLPSPEGNGIQVTLAIQDALHKAFVSVNEEGTEAAAATGVIVGPTSAPPQFVADHPFIFLIRDNVTGSVLFLGRVVDPTAGG